MSFHFERRVFERRRRIIKRRRRRRRRKRRMGKRIGEEEEEEDEEELRNVLAKELPHWTSARLEVLSFRTVSK